MLFSDLGAHLDGFSSVVGHTIVIGASAVRRDWPSSIFLGHQGDRT